MDNTVNAVASPEFGIQSRVSKAERDSNEDCGESFMLPSPGQMVEYDNDAASTAADAGSPQYRGRENKSRFRPGVDAFSIKWEED